MRRLTERRAPRRQTGRVVNQCGSFAMLKVANILTMPRKRGIDMMGSTRYAARWNSFKTFTLIFSFTVICWNVFILSRLLWFSFWLALLYKRSVGGEVLAGQRQVRVHRLALPTATWWFDTGAMDKGGQKAHRKTRSCDTGPYTSGLHLPKNRLRNPLRKFMFLGWSPGTN